MRNTTSAIAVLLIGLLISEARGEYILNGSFENHTGSGFLINISNDFYNRIMSDSIAFGAANEIDLYPNSNPAFQVAAYDGNWQVGLHSDIFGSVDALSLLLSSPLTSGGNYTLRLHSILFGIPGSAPAFPGNFEVGLSTDPFDFGTTIFTGAATSNSMWTDFETDFVAPNDGEYITLRMVSTQEYYATFDAFSLVDAAPRASEVPEPASLALWSLMSVIGVAGWRRKSIRWVV
jgi:hypothetical protein